MTTTSAVSQQQPQPWPGLGFGLCACVCVSMWTSFNLISTSCVSISYKNPACRLFAITTANVSLKHLLHWVTFFQHCWYLLFCICQSIAPLGWKVNSPLTPVDEQSIIEVATLAHQPPEHTIDFSEAYLVCVNVAR